MSIPAASKIRAVGKSYAVSIVTRSPRSLASRMWWTRTGVTPLSFGVLIVLLLLGVRANAS